MLLAFARKNAAGFLDAEGKLTLRLRLQVGRLRRARDVTAFPAPPPSEDAGAA
jgi:hypothetical protein